MKPICKQTRDAGHSRSVVLACDDGHLPYALFVADRIRRVEPTGGFDITICMPDISFLGAADRDGPLRFCEIDVSALPDLPMAKAWISGATYFRWLLPAAFEGQYESLLYLDTDTYLRRPGIAHLFDSLTAPVALGAVTDFQRFNRGDPQREAAVRAKLRDLGGRNGEYFNSGVLLMQPGPFLTADMPRRFAEAAQANTRFLPIHKDQDQGAMNLAFANEIVPIDPRYNWATRPWQKMVARYDPVILHFTGRGKPWTIQDDPFVAGFTDEYLQILGQLRPGFEVRPAQGSVAWKRTNPRHGIGVVERIRAALAERRVTKAIAAAWAGDVEDRARRMDAAIAQAEIG